MNRTLPLLLWTLTLLPTVALGAPDVQHEPFSIDLVSADLRDVLQSFEMMSESRLEVAPEVDGKVTVRLTEVSWPTALDAVCESAGCSWRLRGSDPRRLEVGPRASGRLPEGLDAPIRLRLDHVPARQAFTTIAAATGRELATEGDFTTPVSLTLDGVTAETALTALCEGLGCEWSLRRDETLQLRRTAPRASAGGAAGEISADLRDRLRRSLDLSLAGAPLGAVLQSFGQILEVPVEIEDGVEGSVTIELDGSPVAAALDAVCAANGCRWSLEGPGDSPPRLRVTSASG